MKIKKSKLKTIISEEIQKTLLEEGWKDTMADVGKGLGSAAASGLGAVGKAWLSGFTKSDNLLSKVIRRGYTRKGSVTGVAKVDKIFEDLVKALEEFKTHPEATTINLSTPAGDLDSPDEVVDQLKKKLQDEVIKPWIQATTTFRGGDEEEEAAEPEEEEEEETEEVTVPFEEVLRRQVREQLKKRSIS